MDSSGSSRDILQDIWKLRDFCQTKISLHPFLHNIEWKEKLDCHCCFKNFLYGTRNPESDVIGPSKFSVCIPLNVSIESKNDLVESLNRPGLSLDCPIMSSNGSRGAPNGPADMMFVQNLTPQEFQAKNFTQQTCVFCNIVQSRLRCVNALNIGNLGIFLVINELISKI